METIQGRKLFQDGNYMKKNCIFSQIMITTTDPGGLVTMFTLTKNKSTQTVQLLNNKITNTFIPFNHLLFRPVQEFFLYVCTLYALQYCNRMDYLRIR